MLTGITITIKEEIIDSREKRDTGELEGERRGGNDKRKNITCVKSSKKFPSKEKGNDGGGSYNKVHYVYEYNYEINHTF